MSAKASHVRSTKASGMSSQDVALSKTFEILPFLAFLARTWRPVSRAATSICRGQNNVLPSSFSHDAWSKKPGQVRINPSKVGN
jgi:hypothetical protein